MEIEKDLLELKQRLIMERETAKSPTPGAWIVIIALGVFTGQMLYTGTTTAWAEYKLRKAMEAAELSAAQMRLDAARALERSAQTQRELAAKRDQDQNARRTAMETCKFWERQLAQSNTESNRTMRDNACIRANTQ